MNTEILPEFSEVVTLADELSWEFVFRYEGVGASGRGFRHNYKIAWLIDEKSSLHEFISMLGEDDDASLNLYDFYAAYNVKFPDETVCWVSHDGTGVGNIADMSELLSAILHDAGKNYHRAVILNPGEISPEQLAELRVKIFQQFIYLRMCIPVIIRGNSAMTRKRDMRLSVYGAKKAGKSTIINAILGGEYSPSSSELPTPCRIIYTEDRIENRDIFIEYEGRIKYFSKPEDLKNFMAEKFRNAAKDSSPLKDFHVTLRAFPKIMRGVMIVDTPGPNLAGAEGHRNIAYSEIGAEDICLFVMNYSAHLTEDETALFDAVYAKRKCPVIIALNRIDEMYSSEVVKSYERAADYIVSRLNALGYKDFLVVPVSALTAVYVNEIDEAPEHKRVSFSRHIEDLRKKYKGTDRNTAVSFIRSVLKTQKDFHGQDIKSSESLEETGRISYFRSVIMSLIGRLYN